MQVFGSYENLPCADNTVADNLITAYSSEHHPDDGIGRWTDGISVGCEKTTVRGNGVVDATDVGIVFFRSSPAVQRTVIRDNVVISAGNSAYGAYGIDAGHSRGTTHDFTGATIADNRLWTGPDTHFDIGFAVGVRPWFGNLADAGRGAAVVGNTTDGLSANVRVGVAVSGMHFATVQRNDLRLFLLPTGGCPQANFGVDADGFAENGDFQPGAVRVSFVTPSGGSCLGHSAATRQTARWRR